MTVKESPVFGSGVLLWNWNPRVQSMVCEFRKRSLPVSVGAPQSLLVLDSWDKHSKHIVLPKDNEIVASARVSNSLNNRLPFSPLYNEVEISSWDMEISRVVIDPRYRNGFVFLKLMESLVPLCANEKGRVFIDCCIGGVTNIRIERYIEMGFQPYGSEAWDHRYARPTKLLFMSRSVVEECVDRFDVKVGGRLLKKAAKNALAVAALRRIHNIK